MCRRSHLRKIFVNRIYQFSLHFDKLCNIFTGTERMVSMREIGPDQLEQYGILLKHNVMDNGELRFRLLGSDGSCYIRTESSGDSGWQNSHYHTRLSELCLVQEGWVLYAELVDGQVVAKRYTANEHFIIRPMVPHNSYMAPHSILHTIKFGDCTNADWIPCEELDAILRDWDIDSAATKAAQ